MCLLDPSQYYVLDCSDFSKTNLFEADITGILSETLTTHVQSIFADQSMAIGTHPTEKHDQLKG